jgi:hypothetical protein
LTCRIVCRDIAALPVSQAVSKIPAHARIRLDPWRDKVGFVEENAKLRTIDRRLRQFSGHCGAQESGAGGQVKKSPLGSGLEVHIKGGDMEETGVILLLRTISVCFILRIVDILNVNITTPET